MKIRCIIVDDEKPARDELAWLLSAHGDVEVIAQAESASTAMDKVKKHDPDLVFLDIQMPGKSGFDLVKELAVQGIRPYYIFATAYDQYAVKAFEESAVDYLLKPISAERLSKSLSRVRERLETKRSQSLQGDIKALIEKVGERRDIVRISVEKKGRIQLIDPGEIVFCSSEDKKIMVHTTSGKFPLYGIPTMDKLEKHLPDSSFFRCHRVHIVNLEKILEFSPWFNGKYNLTMADPAQSEVIVSKGRVREFKARLGL